jgi:hypothetical protein
MSARMGYIIRQEFTPDRWAIVFDPSIQDCVLVPPSITMLWIGTRGPRTISSWIVLQIAIGCAAAVCQCVGNAKARLCAR